MKRRPFEIAAVMAVFLTLLPALRAAQQPTTDSIKKADDLFRSGKFAEAEKAYAAVLAKDVANSGAVLRLGEIALLGNRFETAERKLKQAIKARPDDERPKSLLAQCYYRQDRYKEAASLHRELGRKAAADQLDSLSGKTPYQVLGDVDVTHVKFEQTDPLPIVKARINGGDEMYLLIDTGAAELILDLEFAERVGATRFEPPETGTFAGGKTADVYRGTIDSIQLGDFRINHVPVGIKKMRRLPMSRRVDGIVGTVLFYHFLATLDYPQDQLTLRRKAGPIPNKTGGAAESAAVHEVPFWMAGTHIMVAWGRLNGGEPSLFFADTGLAGGGFLGHESTIEKSGIDLSDLPSFQGMGGGGPVTVTPFTIKELSLGDVKQRNVTGMAGAFPDSLEYSRGFRIGGIISHGFFRPYALTFDFDRMRLYLTAGP